MTYFDKQREVVFQERRNTGTSFTNNDKFEKDGYLVLKDLWDPEELYHPVPNMRGQLNYYNNNIENFRHLEVEGQVEGSLSRYSHPQYKKIHTGVGKKLEKIIGKKLYTTYYYAVSYTHLTLPTSDLV